MFCFISPYTSYRSRKIINTYIFLNASEIPKEAVATLCLTEITAQRRKVISRLYLMTVKTQKAKLETKAQVLMESDLEGF